MSSPIFNLWRKSKEIGFTASLLCALAWLSACTAFARGAVGRLDAISHGLALAFVLVMALFVGFSGLVSFWILASHIKFLLDGYRINWLTANKWVYEERRADGSIDRIPFSRVVNADGYPAPCEVCLPSETRWAQQAPPWAQGRRQEIMGRIAECCGAKAGGQVQFVDLSENDDADGD